MWSGVFGINRNKVTDSIDFKPGAVRYTDTFGSSMSLLSNDKYTRKKIELYNIQKVTDDEYITSYNNDCLVEITNTKTLQIGRENYPAISDTEKQIKYVKKIMDINRTCITHDFPKPYNIDVITVNDCDTIFHFKSSNWCPWYTEEYITLKKIALNKLLK